MPITTVRTSPKRNADLFNNLGKIVCRFSIELLSVRSFSAVAFSWLSAVVTCALAQTNATSFITDQQPFTNHYEGQYFTPDLNQLVRLRHIEGEGQAGVDAFTDFGLTKFVWGDGGLLMLDLVARINNDADPGFSCGVHRRIVSGDTIFGAGLFYDWQGEFQQGSLAFEVLTDRWSLRSNGYTVLGDDVEGNLEYVTTTSTDIFFQANNILADGLLLHERYEVAMSGADIEFARNIAHSASELFVGAYYYDGEIGSDATGVKGGLRGFLAPDLMASISVSGDDLFGTNVYGGLTWFLGARGRLSQSNLFRQLLTPVERNGQIVKQQVRRTEPTVDPVVLTAGNEPITVVHVYSGAAGSNEGSFEDPYNTLPATQDADIVYVHSGSVFVGQSYTVASHQRLLGEGDGNDAHYVRSDQVGEILIPDGRGWNTRPVIRDAPGNAVTLSGIGSEVSNFIIEDAADNGVIGDGVTDFYVSRNLIRRSGERGIFLTVSGAVDGKCVASGIVKDNGVSYSELQNIQMILASDFRGDVDGNGAVFSATSHGIEITGPYQFHGRVLSSIANNNALDGIAIDVDQLAGDIQWNFGVDNNRDGMVLSLNEFDGQLGMNHANINGDQGIVLRISGNSSSRIKIASNSFDNNNAEGLVLTFTGTGTSLVEITDNEFEDSHGGTGRELLAYIEDAAENDPVVLIKLDGNRSENNLGAGPPFNYELDNEGLLSDGEMTVNLGTNIGTVGISPGVELGEFPQ